MYGILVDTTRCTGCESCVTACVAANDLDKRQAARDRATVPDGLSAERFTSIVPVGGDGYARKSCMHCLEPSCVSACLVGALHKSAEGPVIYDAEKCIGCRYCMLACPFHVPRYEWQATAPSVRKCEMCAERLQRGEQPACVAACPHDALLFGDRDLLLAKAHAKIASEPHRYCDHVWGEHEFGGTCILYISDRDLAALDWPATHVKPIPELTATLIESTPFVGAGVATALLSINWIIRRRQKLAAENLQKGDTDE
jgi:formate dehydrogenase iron-sulfur subunit